MEELLKIGLEELGFKDCGRNTYKIGNEWTLGITDGFIWIEDVCLRIALNREFKTTEKALYLVKVFLDCNN